MDQLQYTYEDYTIGWVCALPNEQAAALFMLDERHEDLPNPSNDQNAYTLGNIGKHKVVIAGLPKGRYGNSSSATVATRMISTFPNIRVGLMVGIGGGIPQKTRLGDVVISCPTGSEPGVVQWDMGKAEYGGQFRRTGSLAPPPTALLTALGKFEADQITSRKKMFSYLDGLRRISNVPKSFLKSDSLKDVLYESNYGHTQGDDCSHCNEAMVVQREPREDDMMIHCGLIASGNQVIKDAILRDNLYRKFDSNVLCVEMEAAGLMNDFPCVVIRGICDYADSHKNKKWQDYAATVAAACAKAFLTVVPASEVDKLQRVEVSITPNVLQDARKYVAGFWGDKQGTGARPATTGSPSEIDDTKKDGIPQSPTPERVQSKDTSSDAKATERSSNAKPREASPDSNSPMQLPLESWLREASSSLAKMVQEGHVDAAMRNIVMGLSQLQIPREGISAPQGANWNSNPQTPPMSPRRGSYPTGGDNGYAQDTRGLGSRSGSYTQTQPRPTYEYRNASTQTYLPEREVKSPAFARSQTYPSDPPFNLGPIYPTPQHTNYGSNVYDIDRGVQDDYYSRLPSYSGQSTNINADQRQRGGKFDQGRGYPVTNMNNNPKLNLNRMNEDLSQTFFTAIEKGKISDINRMLEDGADLEMIDRTGRTPLWCAVQNGRRDVIKILLAKGANTEAHNAYGQTLLSWAVETNRNEVIDMLGYT